MSEKATKFMQEYNISVQDMIAWLENELSCIEHARIGGCPISSVTLDNENIFLAMQDLLETLV